MMMRRRKQLKTATARGFPRERRRPHARRTRACFIFHFTTTFHDGSWFVFHVSRLFERATDDLHTNERTNKPHTFYYARKAATKTRAFSLEHPYYCCYK